MEVFEFRIDEYVYEHLCISLKNMTDETDDYQL